MLKVLKNLIGIDSDGIFHHWQILILSPIHYRKRRFPPVKILSTQAYITVQLGLIDKIHIILFQRKDTFAFVRVHFATEIK